MRTFLRNLMNNVCNTCIFLHKCTWISQFSLNGVDGVTVPEAVAEVSEAVESETLQGNIIYSQNKREPRIILEVHH